MWQRLKTKLQNLFRRPEVPVAVEAFTSSYYVGLGLMLALMTQSWLILIVFTLPALIWWITSLAHRRNRPCIEFVMP